MSFPSRRPAPPRPGPGPGSDPAPAPAPVRSANNKLRALALGVLSGLALGCILMETAGSFRSTRIPAPKITAAKLPDSQSPTLSEPGTSPSLFRQVQGDALGKGRLGRAQPQPQPQPPPSPPPPSLVHPPGDSIHSVMTSSGSGYQNFQGRIMYGTYKLVQQMEGGEKLTGFTRILHRAQPDECMDDIPTFHAQPLHPACDVWCDFPVADRPNAVAQWIRSVQQDPSSLKGAWVALLECDYVWMKPLPTPGDAYLSTALGWQYHFGYIIAQHPDCSQIIRRLYDGGDPADVPNSGPAPALLRFTDLQTVTPLWEQVTANIEKDAEAVKVLGWVREMYAWDIALAKAKVQLETQDPPRSPLISQPPSDHTLGNASIFHYTWGATYNDSTHTIWHWDKRDYTQPQAGVKPQPIPMPPPLAEWRPNQWHLQDGLWVSKELHETLTAMLAQMNKAIQVLPDLTDKFAAAFRPKA